MIAVPALASPGCESHRVDEEEWCAQVAFARATPASFTTCLSFSNDVMFAPILNAYQAAGCSSGTSLQTARCPVAVAAAPSAMGLPSWVRQQSPSLDQNMAPTIEIMRMLQEIQDELAVQRTDVVKFKRGEAAVADPIPRAGDRVRTQWRNWMTEFGASDSEADEEDEPQTAPVPPRRPGICSVGKYGRGEVPRVFASGAGLSSAATAATASQGSVTSNQMLELVKALGRRPRSPRTGWLSAYSQRVLRQP